jgi:hypothetical protein
MWVALLYVIYYFILAAAVGLHISASSHHRAAPACVIGVLSSHFVLGGFEAANDLPKAKRRYSGAHGGLNLCTDVLLITALGFAIAWLVSVSSGDPTGQTPWLAALALQDALIGNGGCLWVRVAESKKNNTDTRLWYDLQA